MCTSLHLLIMVLSILILLLISPVPAIRIKNCSQPLGSSCVEITKCKFFVDLMKRSPYPRPKAVIKVLRDHHCGLYKNVPKVCCYVTSQQSHGTKNMSDLLYHKNIKLLPFDSCGKVHFAALGSRIINGYGTLPLEFPWMALIVYILSNGLDFGCAGTVITDNYVLTAAHCVHNLKIDHVRLGEHDITSVRDCDFFINCAPPVQNIDVADVIVHPEYVPKTLANDIALIRLANKANFNQSNIQPICLPFGRYADLNLHGKIAVISGWGVTENGFRNMQLLKAIVPTISNTLCNKLYQGRISISDGQICAGVFKGRDSCGGDSGGPLQLLRKINKRRRFIQYGIISYGSKRCGIQSQPGVYTRITHYLKWILDNLKP